MIIQFSDHTELHDNQGVGNHDTDRWWWSSGARSHLEVVLHSAQSMWVFKHHRRNDWCIVLMSYCFWVVVFFWERGAWLKYNNFIILTKKNFLKTLSTHFAMQFIFTKQLIWMSTGNQSLCLPWFWLACERIRQFSLWWRYIYTRCLAKELCRTWECQRYTAASTMTKLPV